MNYSNVLFLISDKIRAIRVSYEENGRNQTIKKTFDPDIKVNDFVIVETNTRHQMTVCKVEAVDVEVDFDSDDQLGWIISRVDLDAFEEYKRQEREAISVIKEAEKQDRKVALQQSIMRSTASTALKALPVCNIDVDADPKS